MRTLRLIKNIEKLIRFEDSGMCNVRLYNRTNPISKPLEVTVYAVLR